MTEKRIPCPKCQDVEYEQYTCTTCWKQGGNGTLAIEINQEDIHQWCEQHNKVVVPRKLSYKEIQEILKGLSPDQSSHDQVEAIHSQLVKVFEP